MPKEAKKLSSTVDIEAFDMAKRRQLEEAEDKGMLTSQ